MRAWRGAIRRPPEAFPYLILDTRYAARRLAGAAAVAAASVTAAARGALPGAGRDEGMA